MTEKALDAWQISKAGVDHSDIIDWDWFAGIFQRGSYLASLFPAVWQMRELSLLALPDRHRKGIPAHSGAYNNRVSIDVTIAVPPAQS